MMGGPGYEAPSMSEESEMGESGEAESQDPLMNDGSDDSQEGGAGSDDDGDEDLGHSDE